jgi:ribulose-5-phosphate 4-epimerase/fuculose-1-phosphate aldolase
MVSSTGGNVSARTPSGLLITPTGHALADLRPRALVAVGGSGAVEGGCPSKELPFHAGIYARRPDVGAVIHGHSAVAIAVAGMLEPDAADAFPAYTAGYVARVGRLPLLPYHASGSAALAAGIVDALGPDGRAVLLRNHGFVTVGPTLRAALETAEELMDALRVFVLTGGRAPALPDGARETPAGPGAAT